MNKSYLLPLLVLLFLSGCRIGTKKNPHEKLLIGKNPENVECCSKGPVNQLTDAEKAQGWELLFDGQTTTGWRGYNKKSFPSAWVIEDGTIRCRSESARGEAGKADGGDLVYSKKLYSSFDLRMEWKVSKGGNSGIFYLGREVDDWPLYKSAPEMQILDNENSSDPFKGTNGNREAGSLYDLIPARPQNARPAGEWNSIEIICDNRKVVHRQNGAVVVQYELGTPEWKALVQKSKFPGLNPDWENVAKEGLIGLQDKGYDVWFRNIKIRVL